MDMVTLQKKQPSKSTTHTQILQSKQTTSLLCTSNRINLPLSPAAVMATPNSATDKLMSKENRKACHHNSFSLKDDVKPQTWGDVRSSEKHKPEKRRDGASSSRCHDERIVEKPTSFTRPNATPGANAIQSRALMHVEAATEHHTYDDQYDARGNGLLPPMKNASLSMARLVHSKDEEKTVLIPTRSAWTEPAKYEEDVNPFSSPKSFSVQLEEIKTSRMKSWSFSQGKAAADNVVVMFPNPTFDETSMPGAAEMAANATTTKRPCLLEAKPACASTAGPTEKGASTHRKEKIVRLTPCSTTSNVQKLKQLAASQVSGAGASKRTSPKRQKWLCNLTHPPFPTLIRRLPESHEMKEIRPTKLHCVLTTLSPVENKLDEEDSQALADADSEDHPKEAAMRRNSSFGNPSSDGGISNARRSSSLLPAAGGGGHSFSFLSKHFNAWKLVPK